MKQIAQNYRSGKLSLVEAPLPACKPGGVLVRTEYSVVSAGTEMMKVNESKLSLLAKARARPDQVKKVAQSISQQGLLPTVRKVLSRLDELTPLGYSLAGTVIEIGAGIREFTVGQRVACGGNLHALHSEYNWVPKNLCVTVPDHVPSEHAAFTTVGAIAMQGFRQAEARLGETACVIGLGLIGQLLLQILRAAGITVIGIDIDEDRCRLAEAQGALAACVPDALSIDRLLGILARRAGSAGADHVFLTAGGATNQPVELAVRIARDRGRIVDIGKCRLDLPWNDFYEKELDLRLSRSYGPGRYDATYEESGVDYPLGYVRWTERRNMQCFVDLLATGKIDVGALISDITRFDEAPRVYEQMADGSHRGLATVFQYRSAAEEPARPRSVPLPRAIEALPRGVVGVGMIGCGNYARSVILPALLAQKDVALAHVVTTRSLSAVDAQVKFRFERASTEVADLLRDDAVHAVMIMTRHSSHARLVCEALRAGKAVFVEKPLALDAGELAAIAETVEETGNHRLMVGFNRRFAPSLTALRNAWGPRTAPCSLTYTVNAGPLDATSWYARSDSEGSRFVGEGCHFIDVLSWWLGSDPSEVYAAQIGGAPDDVVATLLYPDGSLANIAYLTRGDRRHPKERFEIFGEGRIARLVNFSRAELWQGGKPRISKSLFGVEKGHKAEMTAFLQAVRQGGTMPIPLDSLFATSAASLAIMRSAATRRPEIVTNWLSRDASGASALPSDMVR